MEIMNPSRVLIRAGVIADGRGFVAAPGAILLEGGRIIAAGRPEALGEVADVAVVDRPRDAVIPSLVNLHAHLDLSHIGPIPFEGLFADWVQTVRNRRAMTGQAISESVQKGVELVRKGGTGLVGDIAGAASFEPIAALRRSGLPGVAFLEVFGIGQRHPAAIHRLGEALSTLEAFENGVALGLQPHAPYSCAAQVYRFAAESGHPVSTHLAETVEELEFVEQASGPLADMIRGFKIWDESIVGSGQHPLDLLGDALSAAPFVVAHLNYIEDRHIGFLASTRTSVAYCPRASAYFGHPVQGRPPHRYRDMVEAGINVGLGTDSLLCLDTADRISVLDEMRLLFRRDGTDPTQLLRMATLNGARALGFDERLFTLDAGLTAGLVAVPLDSAQRAELAGVMRSDSAPEWVAGPFPANPSWLMRSGPQP